MRRHCQLSCHVCTSSSTSTDTAEAGAASEGKNGMDVVIQYTPIHKFNLYKAETQDSVELNPNILIQLTRVHLTTQLIFEQRSPYRRLLLIWNEIDNVM